MWLLLTQFDPDSPTVKKEGYFFGPGGIISFALNMDEPYTNLFTVEGEVVGGVKESPEAIFKMLEEEVEEGECCGGCKG